MRRVVRVVLLAVLVAVAVPVVGRPAAGTLQQTVPAPDFDGDGFGDLAVGAPGEDAGAAADAGAVSVAYGSAGGLLAGGQVLTQGAGGVPGASEGGDRFGAAMATGNLNGDAYADLAIGAPGEDLAGAADAGAVVVLFGSAAGLTGAGGRLLTQGNPEPGDRFGFSLETGELTGGGLDLVVGAPGEQVDAAGGAGAVSVVTNPGSEPGEQLLHQGAAGVPGSPEPGDAFGWALAAGDFNDSAGQDSLAVGAPGEDVGSAADAGAVMVRYAPGFGGTVGLRQLLQDRPEPGDRFGTALAAGFLDDPADGSLELAVGAPGEQVGSQPAAGAVSVVHSDASGFLPGSQLVYQGTAGVPGTPEAGDQFGADLAAGGFDDGLGDLAVGVPGEDVGAVADAGVLDVLSGGGGRQLTQQDAAGAVEAGDRFGQALSEPFFLGSDAFGDLAVGAPGETVGGARDAGAASALLGAAGGLGAGGRQLLSQGAGGLGGAAEAGDLAGAAFS